MLNKIYHSPDAFGGNGHIPTALFRCTVKFGDMGNDYLASGFVTEQPTNGAADDGLGMAILG